MSNLPIIARRAILSAAIAALTITELVIAFH
jgi:hypothetical protein